MKRRKPKKDIHRIFLGLFLKLSKEASTFARVICNKCLCLKTVLEFKLHEYDLDLAEIVHKVFNNSKSYICKTCHISFKKSSIRTQAVCKRLQIFYPLPELKNLNRLERILVS